MSCNEYRRIKIMTKEIFAILKYTKKKKFLKGFRKKIK